MGFLDRLLKPLQFHWSLLVVIDGQPRCAMLAGSVYSIVGYCLGNFKNGAEPLENCGLLLKSNHANKGFWLRAKHVTSDGQNLTPSFYDDLRSLGAEYEERHSGLEPFCREVKPDGTLGKEMPITWEPDFDDPNWFEKEMEPPDKVTFLSLVYEVFPKD